MTQSLSAEEIAELRYGLSLIEPGDPFRIDHGHVEALLAMASRLVELESAVQMALNQYGYGDPALEMPETNRSGFRILLAYVQKHHPGWPGPTSQAKGG